MAATCVSNSGIGSRPDIFHTISRACRAAWNTLTTFRSAMRSRKGMRSMSGASASTATATSSEASCSTQSFGQNVVSRRNSVSTVTNGWRARRRQTAASSSVVVINVIRLP